MKNTIDEDSPDACVGSNRLQKGMKNTRARGRLECLPGSNRLQKGMKNTPADFIRCEDLKRLSPYFPLKRCELILLRCEDVIIFCLV
jgi:hypothetical protein